MPSIKFFAELSFKKATVSLLEKVARVSSLKKQPYPLRRDVAELCPDERRKIIRSYHQLKPAHSRTHAYQIK